MRGRNDRIERNSVDSVPPPVRGACCSLIFRSSILQAEGLETSCGIQTEIFPQRLGLLISLVARQGSPNPRPFSGVLAALHGGVLLTFHFQWSINLVIDFSPNSLRVRYAFPFHRISEP